MCVMKFYMYILLHTCCELCLIDWIHPTSCLLVVCAPACSCLIWQRIEQDIWSYALGVPGLAWFRDLQFLASGSEPNGKRATSGHDQLPRPMMIASVPCLFKPHRTWLQPPPCTGDPSWPTLSAGKPSVWSCMKRDERVCTTDRTWYIHMYVRSTEYSSQPNGY